MSITVIVFGAVAALKYSSKIGDWFTAERGAADGKNGWV